MSGAHRAIGFHPRDIRTRFKKNAGKPFLRGQRRLQHFLRRLPRCEPVRGLVAVQLGIGGAKSFLCLFISRRYLFASRSARDSQLHHRPRRRFNSLFVRHSPFSVPLASSPSSPARSCGISFADDGRNRLAAVALHNAEPAFLIIQKFTVRTLGTASHIQYLLTNSLDIHSINSFEVADNSVIGYYNSVRSSIYFALPNLGGNARDSPCLA